MLPSLRKRRAAGGGRAVSGSASVRPPASTYYSYSTSPRPPGGVPHKAQYAPSSFFASARFRGMFLARPATCESTTDVASRLSRAQPPKAVQQLHSIRLGLTVVTERTERARARSPPCPAPCRVSPDIDGSWNPPPGGPGNHGGKEHLSMYCYLDPPPSDAHLPACAALNPDCPGPASQLPQMRTSQRTITGDSQEYMVDAR